MNEKLNQVILAKNKYFIAKLILEQELLKKIATKKSHVTNKINKTWNSRKLSNTARNAGRLTAIKLRTYEEYKIEVIDYLKGLWESEDLYVIIPIPPRFKNKIFRYLSEYIIIYNSSENYALISPIANKKWKKGHEITQELIMEQLTNLDTELDSFEWIDNYKNWINPKLTNNLERNKTILLNFFK